MTKAFVHLLILWFQGQETGTRLIQYFIYSEIQFAKQRGFHGNWSVCINHAPLGQVFIILDLITSVSVITAPSCGKVMFLNLSVSHFFHGGVVRGTGAYMAEGVCGRGYVGQGVCVAGGCLAGERWPLQRVVRILLECILVDVADPAFAMRGTGGVTKLPGGAYYFGHILLENCMKWKKMDREGLAPMVSIGSANTVLELANWQQHFWKQSGFLDSNLTWNVFPFYVHFGLDISSIKATCTFSVEYIIRIL